MSTFAQPLYDSHSFARLPHYLYELLSSQGYEAVVLILVDGFGWRFVEQFQDEPFLKRIGQEGQVERWSAQFPSTTASHLTTLHTGQTVGEHGILEWNYYEPSLDALISPLPFSYAGDSTRETLKAAGFRARNFLPNETIYRRWRRDHIQTTVFQPRTHTPSSYSDVLLRGARVLGYKTLAEALVNLGQALQETRPPACFILYYDRIDSLGHDYGPAAPQTQAEVLHFLLAMEHILSRSCLPARRTLFLLTADHGQVEADPATAIYLNCDKAFAGLERFLRTDRRGRPLVPAGSPRDFFLYIHAGMVEEAQEFLAVRLQGRAEVQRIETLAEAGFFGPRLSPQLRAHAGDLVILPYAGESVWWYEKDRFVQKFHGLHGGLTPQEMDIPLLRWETG